MSTNIQRVVSGAALACALAVNGCTAAAPSAVASGASPAPAVVPPGGAVDVAAEGWENLLPPADLHGFRRVPLDPLASKPVWQVRPDGSLFIDGTGAKEMLLSEREIGDGELHVEWRFLAHDAVALAGAAPVASTGAAPAAATGAAPTYNGGIYVRTALDGKSWVQLQVAHADQPPVVGDLIAQVPGRSERVDVFQAQASAASPLGEWNSYDISMRGPSIELTVNGKPAAVWMSCPLSSGHVGLQAEGAPIEVRVFRYRPS